jgi:hypothetical protein
MPAKSPVTFRPSKFLQGPTKTTMKVLAEALADLTDKYVALLVKLDSDTGLDESDYASTLTPQPRISAS